MSGQDWVERLKQRIDLLEVAQQYTEMQKKGNSWRGPCPLHDGDDPNFAVNPEQGFYKCFVCGESGDAFTLVEEIEAVEFLEAAKKLARMFGIEVPSQQGGRQLSPNERKRQSLQNDIHQQALQRPLWKKLELQNLVEDFRLGVHQYQGQDQLMVPLLGGRTIPVGWLIYTVARANQPWRHDFHPASRQEAAGDVLFGPRNIRGLIRNQPLVVVDDPIAALKLFATQHQAVVAPASPPDNPVQEGALRESHLEEIADMGVRQVVFLLSLGGSSQRQQRRLQRLHATEVRLLERGIEPLTLLPRIMRTSWEKHCQDSQMENRSSWGRVQALNQQGHTLEQDFQNNRLCVDVFQMRLGRLLQHFEKSGEQPLTHPRIRQKIQPSLRAVQQSQRRALYHAYMAWAGRELGFGDRWRFSKWVHQQQTPAAYETF